MRRLEVQARVADRFVSPEQGSSSQGRAQRLSQALFGAIGAVQQRAAVQAQDESRQGIRDAQAGQSIGDDPHQERIRAYDRVKGERVAIDYQARIEQLLEEKRHLSVPELQQELQQDAQGYLSQLVSPEAQAVASRKIYEMGGRALTQHVKRIQKEQHEDRLKDVTAFARHDVEEILQTGGDSKALHEVMESRIGDLKELGLSPKEFRRVYLDSVLNLAVATNNRELPNIAFIKDEAGQMMFDHVDDQKQVLSVIQQIENNLEREEAQAETARTKALTKTQEEMHGALVNKLFDMSFTRFSQREDIKESLGGPDVGRGEYATRLQERYLKELDKYAYEIQSSIDRGLLDPTKGKTLLTSVEEMIAQGGFPEESRPGRSQYLNRKYSEGTLTKEDLVRFSHELSQKDYDNLTDKLVAMDNREVSQSVSLHKEYVRDVKSSIALSYDINNLTDLTTLDGSDKKQAINAKISVNRAMETLRDQLNDPQVKPRWEDYEKILNKYMKDGGGNNPSNIKNLPKELDAKLNLLEGVE